MGAVHGCRGLKAKGGTGHDWTSFARSRHGASTYHSPVWLGHKEGSDDRTPIPIISAAATRPALRLLLKIEPNFVAVRPVLE